MRKSVDTSDEPEVFAVEINSNHGIGAKFIWALEIIAYCDENNRLPKIKFTYPKSKDKEDYFTKYFRIKSDARSGLACDYMTINSIGGLGLGKSYNNKLKIDYAHYLINKYIDVQEWVLKEVNDFCDTHFNKKSVLGVHYRGTDKSKEAPYVSFEEVYRNIAYYLEKYPETDLVFLSSDDEHFINQVHTTALPKPVVYRRDAFRSSDNQAIHHSSHSKLDVNRDAIINCLILSRCNTVMKTASILSAVSVLFNTEVSVVLLNKPFYDWYPEKGLAEKVLYEPID